jgi:hypothetical protein
MWPHLSLTIDVTALLAILGICWKANRVLNRFLDVLREFPPHRHVGNQVLYPKDMTPEDPQQLDDHVVKASRA